MDGEVLRETTLPADNGNARECVYGISTYSLSTAIYEPHDGLEGVTHSPEEFIHGLFEEQVRRSPESIALVLEDCAVSFLELNIRANKVARQLLTRGAGPDRLIGLFVERNIDMVIGMLAILKAGAAYLPIDPAYPSQRISFVFEDATPHLILTQRHLRSRLCDRQEKVVILEDLMAGPSGPDLQESVSPDLMGLNGQHLAFVIYTSGSTGTPKGAMNAHRGMANRIRNHAAVEAFNRSDVCSQKTSISFVDHVFEIFGALCSGCPLVIIPPDAVINGIQMATLVAKYGISQLTTVPSMARSLLDSERALRDLRGLRNWTLSGEEVKADLLLKLQRAVPQCEFIVLYGASEISSDAAYLRTREFAGERVAIGAPIPNVQVYVLDEDRLPVSAGVTGRIYVGGVGVGRGYLGRPALSAQRFIADPFSNEPSARLYDTGDLGRWRNDGLLEYQGRVDNQVKIRGVRVELSEIESVILRQEFIREAVVIAREDDRTGTSLLAYISLRDDQSAAAALPLLRQTLSSELPSFMLPAAFVTLGEFPHTPNGKLDRRALPTPGVTAYSSRRYEPPEDENERLLAGIWSELLGIDRVGRRDSFFELGGHSLLLVRLLERLRAANRSTDMTSIFREPILMDMAKSLSWLKADFAPTASTETGESPPGLTNKDLIFDSFSFSREQLSWLDERVPGGRTNIEDAYPLTALQEGMLFHQLHDERSSYILSVALSVPSEDIFRSFVTALQCVVDRHPALRTMVLWEGLPDPIQIVCREVVLAVQWVDLGKERVEGEDLKDLCRQGAKSIKLGQPAPMVRVTGVAGGSARYALLQVHHIVCDNQSLRSLIAEALLILGGREGELSPALPFRAHVEFERLENKDKAFATFREMLSDYKEPSAPFGVRELSNTEEPLSEASIALSRELTRRLRALARALSVTPATLFHAAWALVISCASGQADVVYGTVLRGNLQGEIEPGTLLGLRLNTLPLRFQLLGLSAGGLISAAHHGLAQLMTHVHTPLAEVQRLARLPVGAQIFSALINFRGAEGSVHPGENREADISVVQEYGGTNYPFVLSIDESADQYLLTAEAANPAETARLNAYVCTALESLVFAMEVRPLSRALDLQVLPKDEVDKLRVLMNISGEHPTREGLIHAAFEQLAHSTPLATAVVYGRDHLSYGELNARSDLLARFLRHNGVGPEKLVGLHLERGPLLIIGILGVLKAGGAYLPLDPTSPPDRIRFILSDAGPTLLLTQERLKSLAQDSGTHSLTLDGDWRLIAATEEASPPEVRVQPENLAYVIYTSGSTGNPKGVMVEHRHVTRLFSAVEDRFSFGRTDVWTLFHSYAFDFSVWEIWGALSYGGLLVVVPHEMARDPDEFYQLLCDNEVTVLNQTPTAFSQLIGARSRNPRRRHSIETIVFGGEALDLNILKPWIATESLHDTQLVNMYGITETTVHVTYHLLEEEEIRTGIARRIGRPINDLGICLLDQCGRIAPQGTIGEICVGGKGVTRGYLKRPELTAQRFVPGQGANRLGNRWYKSGDLARWRPDGSLEYFGRNDQQVKIRGFRIELGEIEAHLASHPEVREATVINGKDSFQETRLIAYLVPTVDRVGRSGQGCEDLRRYLEQRLPEYMIPAAFVILDQFPLTVNGKLDRAALPAPEMGLEHFQSGETPLGETEQKLAEIWQSLLRTERIGRGDSFFNLGGHSLSAMRLSVRIREVFEVEVSTRAIFSNAVLKQLALRIEEARAAAPAPEAGPMEGIDDLVSMVASLREDEVRALLKEVKKEIV